MAYEHKISHVARPRGPLNTDQRGPLRLARTRARASSERYPRARPRIRLFRDACPVDVGQRRILDKALRPLNKDPCFVRKRTHCQKTTISVCGTPNLDLLILQ